MRTFRIPVAVLLFVLGLVGCEEKRTCHFSCYEKSLKGYEDGNCGHVLEQTEEECHAFVCNAGDPPPRTAWGEEPEWCEEKPEPPSP